MSAIHRPVLVIGGRGEIGQAIVVRLQPNVLCTSRHPESNLPGALALDLCHPAGVASFLAAVAPHAPLGGVAFVASVHEGDVAAANTQNTWALIRWLVPHLAPGASIVLYGTAAARLPAARRDPYIASKGALLAELPTLARELGPRGIRINAIDLAVVDQQGRPPPPFPLQAPFHALGRMTTPAEVAELTLFLLSPASSALTGAVIDATGGLDTAAVERWMAEQEKARGS